MAVLYTVTLGGDYGAGNGRTYSQVLIDSHVHDGTDFEANFINPGWDWMMMIVDVEAQTGTNVITVAPIPWIESTQGYSDPGFTTHALGTLSFDEGDISLMQYWSWGPGAVSTTWGGDGAVAGPLPGKFQMHFDSSTSADITFSISAWMGKGMVDL